MAPSGRIRFLLFECVSSSRNGFLRWRRAGRGAENIFGEERSLAQLCSMKSDRATERIQTLPFISGPILRTTITDPAGCGALVREKAP